MKTMLRNTLGTLVILILVTVMMAAPPEALARMQMSNGNGQQGGGGEGDPLDSNDYGSGDGSGGDIVHQRRIVPRGPDGVIFDLEASGKRLILRVDFLGEVPVFYLEIISVGESRVEANHVH